MNEQETLPLLKERLQRLADLPETYEFVFVSDGSTDRSITCIEQWAAEDPRVKLVVFTRNFGHQSAVCAGLEFAQGDYIAIIDADLQDPPEVMLAMYRTARAEDLDVVYSVREHRDTPPLKRLAYRLFYRLYSYLAESPVNVDSGDFSVLSRRAVNGCRASSLLISMRVWRTSLPMVIARVMIVPRFCERPIWEKRGSRSQAIFHQPTRLKSSAKIQ